MLKEKIVVRKNVNFERSPHMAFLEVPVISAEPMA